MVVGGDVLGTTFENDLFAKHKIMVPPRVSGRVVEMMPEDQYRVRDTVCVIEDANGKQ